MSGKPHKAPLPAGLQHGIVVAAFGRHYTIAPLNRQHHAEHIHFDAPLKCYPRGKKSHYACGDHVEIEAAGPDQGVIVGLLPRQNLLWRSDAFREKLIAANLTQIVIVTATEPVFSDLLLSRCIAAAEQQQIKTLIVLNKADLTGRLAEARAVLQPFAALGYRCIELSALQHNVDALAAALDGEKSIFVGQSGMGKSTLTNALIPGAEAATREISAALNSGKHTTTFARLYPYGERGWLIDSPGLQVFGLAHLTAETLAQSFIEFRPCLGECRFRNCRHEAEPGCALREAVSNGSIHPRRFEHFRHIRDEIAQSRQQSRGW